MSGLVGRAALGGKDAPDGDGVERIGAQAVNRLGGKGHQAAGADERGGLLQLRVHHSPGSSLLSPKILPVFFQTR